MIRAVLFDLDGTLLDIDLDSFLSAYFSALGPVLAEVTGLPARTALGALQHATNAMLEPHFGRTNKSVFDECFAGLTGANLSEPSVADAIESFYAKEFPLLQSTHGPREGAARAVAAAQDAGLRLALATNPIFPRAAVLERLRWAEIEAAVFDIVTTYETAEACKPLPAYFMQVADALGVAPHECLMVGDDRALDVPAAVTGMKTFYVGAGCSDRADWQGSLQDLSARLESLDA